MGFNSGFKGLNQSWCAIILLTQECCICRLANDNAFPFGQVPKEYCREEAMSVVTQVISCTAVEKKQENLLCWLPRGTEKSSLLDFQCRVPCQAWETSSWTEHDHYTIRPKHWRGLQRFQLKRMVLGNNIISPLRVRGLDYRSGSEFNLQ